MNKKKYRIQRNELGNLFLLIAIVAVIFAEIAAIMSSRANASYAIGNLTLIMQMSEASAVILVLIYLISPYMRGRLGMIIVDIGRLATVIMMTINFVYMMQARTTLIGYVWISGLESGNGVEEALNYGVISAGLYMVSIIFLAITCGFEFVVARKIKRTPEVIKAEIKELENELEGVQSGKSQKEIEKEMKAEEKKLEEQQILNSSLTDGLFDQELL